MTLLILRFAQQLPTMMTQICRPLLYERGFWAFVGRYLYREWTNSSTYDTHLSQSEGQVFQHRWSTFSEFFYQLVAQLLVFPVGRLSARFLPNKTIFGFEINPGPFSIKEHVRWFLECLIRHITHLGFQGACNHHGYRWCSERLCNRHRGSSTSSLPPDFSLDMYGLSPILSGKFCSH